MTRAEVERLIEDVVMKGGMAPGLYSTGFCHVLVDIDGDDISIRWFDIVSNLSNSIIL